MAAHAGLHPTDDVAHDTSEHVYPSGRRVGRAVIICNIHFKLYNVEGKEIPAAPRTIQELDLPRLDEVLSKLGFRVDIHKDLTTTEMITTIRKAASEEDSDCGSFLCIISSHGTWFDSGDKLEDMIYGTNGILNLQQLVNQVYTPNLKGKPKIFLVQCCRGDRYVSNIAVTQARSDGTIVTATRKKFTGSNIMQRSAEPKPENFMTQHGLPYHIPIKKDCFVHFSSNPGFVSFPKKKKGTPFLQAWCDVLQHPKVSREIHDLATIVNAKVCQDYETNVPGGQEEGLHQRKQTPQYVSMLGKDYNFPSVENVADLAEHLDVAMKAP